MITTKGRDYLIQRAEKFQPNFRNLEDVLAFSVQTFFLKNPIISKKDDILPPNWNSNEYSYSFSFTNSTDSSNILLRGIVVGPKIFFHLNTKLINENRTIERILEFNVEEFSKLINTTSSTEYSRVFSIFEWEYILSQVNSLISCLKSPSNMSSISQIAYSIPFGLVFNSMFEATVFAVHLILLENGFDFCGIIENIPNFSEKLLSKNWNILINENENNVQLKPLISLNYIDILVNSNSTNEKTNEKINEKMFNLKAMSVGNEEIIIHIGHNASGKVFSFPINHSSVLNPNTNLDNFEELYPQKIFSEFAIQTVIPLIKRMRQETTPQIQPKVQTQTQTQTQTQSPFPISNSNPNYGPRGIPNPRFPFWNPNGGFLPGIYDENFNGQLIGPNNPIFGGGGIPPNLGHLPGTFPARIFPTTPYPGYGTGFYGPAGTGEPDPDHERPPGPNPSPF